MDTSSRNRVVALVAFLAFALGGSQAFACGEADYLANIDTHYSCLSPDDAVNKRAAEQRKLFFKDATGSEILVPRASAAIERLKGEVDVHSGQQSADVRRYFDKLHAYLDAAGQKLLGAASIDAIAAQPASFETLLPDFWLVNASVRDEAGGLPATILEEAGCDAKSAPDPACDAALKRAIAVGDDVYVTYELIRDVHSDARSRFVTDAKRRTEQWHAYLYDTQFQFWWELAFNRYEESRCPKAFNARVATLVNKKCHAQAQDALGNLLGFREVPDYRAILLHPDLGVGYISDEPKGERFKPLLVFQWIGFQWWNWSDSKVSGLRGVSLVSTVSDTATTARTGVGLQFQYGGLALALTSHAGSVAVTLNTGLIDRLGTVNQSWADKFKAELEQ